MKIPSLGLPSVLLSLNVVGLYSFSGYVNLLSPDSNAGYILVRLIIFLLTLATILVYHSRIRFRLNIYLLPVIFFFMIYSVRFFENVMISNIYVPPGPMVVFPVFFINCILTSILVAFAAPFVKDRQFYFTMSFICAIFLFGMVLNYNELLATFEWRLSLPKIDPISLGHIAFSFVIFFVAAAVVANNKNILLIIFLPCLFLIVVYARSRGPYIAGGLTLFIFFLCRFKSRRAWLFSVLASIAIFSNPALIQEIMDRLLFTGYQDRSTVIRLISMASAWEQFLADPLIGRYVIVRLTGFYPHNIYLEVLMSVGLIGAVPFFLHIGAALRSAFALIVDRNSPMFAVFIALMLIREIFASAFSGSLYGNTVFWITSISTIVLWVNRKDICDSEVIPDAERGNKIWKVKNFTKTRNA